MDQGGLQQILRSHLKSAFGSRRLNEITPGHIRAFRTEKQGGRLARSTVNGLVGVLRAILNQAVGDHLLTFNPVLPPKRRTRGQT